MVMVRNNWNTYNVLKAYQNGNEYNLWAGYIIGWAMSWVTITSSSPLCYSTDIGYLKAGASYLNWTNMYGIITGYVRNVRSSSTDRYYNVIMRVSKAPWQDFSFSQTDGTQYSTINPWLFQRWLTNGTVLKILACYYENYNSSTNYSHYYYDEWTINLSNFSMSTWTWNLNTQYGFYDFPVSEIGLDGYTDVSGITRWEGTWTIPWFINGWFTNLALNSSYYPKFVLA